jgi:hypothetical protein
MALILVHERKVRVNQIQQTDKQPTLAQLLRPASLAVMQRARQL